jgi:hypothetical protein
VLELAVRGVIVLLCSWRMDARTDLWFLWYALRTLPPALLTAHLLRSLIDIAVPVAGRAGTVFPGDMAVGVTASVGCLLFVVSFVPLMRRARRYGWAALAVGVLVLALMISAAVVFPYSDAAPKRVRLAHTASLNATGSCVLDASPAMFDAEDVFPVRVFAADPFPIRPVFDQAGSGVNTTAWTCSDPECAFSASLGANRTVPCVQVDSDIYVPALDERRLSLSVQAAGTLYTELRLLNCTVVWWSFGALPPAAPHAADSRILVVSGHPSGAPWSLQLAVRGIGTVAMVVAAHDYHLTAALVGVASALPQWAVLDPAAPYVTTEAHYEL